MVMAGFLPCLRRCRPVGGRGWWRSSFDSGRRVGGGESPGDVASLAFRLGRRKGDRPPFRCRIHAEGLSGSRHDGTPVRRLSDAGSWSGGEDGQCDGLCDGLCRESCNGAVAAQG